MLLCFPASHDTDVSFQDDHWQHPLKFSGQMRALILKHHALKNPGEFREPRAQTTQHRFALPIGSNALFRLHLISGPMPTFLISSALLQLLFPAEGNVSWWWTALELVFLCSTYPPPPPPHTPHPLSFSLSLAGFLFLRSFFYPICSWKRCQSFQKRAIFFFQVPGINLCEGFRLKVKSKSVDHPWPLAVLPADDQRWCMYTSTPVHVSAQCVDVAEV